MFYNAIFYDSSRRLRPVSMLPLLFNRKTRHIVKHREFEFHSRMTVSSRSSRLESSPRRLIMRRSRDACLVCLTYRHRLRLNRRLCYPMAATDLSRGLVFQEIGRAVSARQEAAVQTVLKLAVGDWPRVSNTKQTGFAVSLHVRSAHVRERTHTRPT